MLAAGSELLFCAHHWRDHGSEVSGLEGVVIHDETEKLV